MNLDENPRPSVGDTLRAALPDGWLRAMVTVRWLFFLGFVAPGVIMEHFVARLISSLKVNDTSIFAFQISSVACFLFLSWLVVPVLAKRQQQKIQKSRAREYSRQQKVMAEHQQILERWQREVKPEGDAQNTL